jgi:hypothetical protein
MATCGTCGGSGSISHGGHPKNCPCGCGGYGGGNTRPCGDCGGTGQR